MGKRNTARRLAMQCLYQLEIKQNNFDEILNDTIISANYIEATKDFALILTKGTYENLGSVDEIIKNKSKDWSFDRIAKIDKSILRVAIHEMINMDTPVSVVINEAIEMAKKYSTEESVKFINGILGNIKPNGGEKR
ncbi:MAG: transcription antitermination factor NusB [Candidatus Margulisiibacteriota bacterium]|nr:MAG: transcription antitermination factor NusB [Candidatus Margulisiibacteriota bacterium]HCY35624.1 transcription antitermination factor NusB [Candidatus Margulisiibacteriota bacterium]